MNDVTPGDLVVFSGCYTLYDPETHRAFIEMTSVPRQGIVIEICEREVKILSNNVFCTLHLDEGESSVQTISEA